MAHLLSNAIDAVPVGGEVILAASRQDGSIELAVRDNGTGITADDQRRLFQPFFSTKGDLGNGLGLYISKEIVERHKGTMRIESVREKGTVARVMVPDQLDERVVPG